LRSTSFGGAACVFLGTDCSPCAYSDARANRAFKREAHMTTLGSGAADEDA